MRIMLSVEQPDPPVGWASPMAGEAPAAGRLPFEGWLGLLAALQHLLEESDPSGPYARADDARS